MLYLIPRPWSETKFPPLKSHSCSRPPTVVTVHPAALFSILDHFLRRADSQERVIGTLLGTRTEREVEIRSAFPVLHSETDEQVAVDMDYHTQMYEMQQKVAPKEVIVGWCAHSILFVCLWSLTQLAGILQDRI